MYAVHQVREGNAMIPMWWLLVNDAMGALREAIVQLAGGQLSLVSCHAQATYQSLMHRCTICTSSHQ